MTGRQRNIGPPVYERFVVPLALMLVLLTGIGPLIAWRRATVSNLKRNLVKPAIAGVVVLVALVALGVTQSWTALLMFGFGSFVVAGIVQEYWRGVRARRAVSHEAVPVALVSLVKRNRRRYGGYLAHLGIVVLFVGVSASSSFKHVRDVDLRPGQTAHVGDYTFTYVKPTSELHAAANGRLERISFGAQLKVRHGNGSARVMNTSKDYFPAMEDGAVSRFFDGESTTEVALHTSLRNDTWAAIGPDIGSLQPTHRGGRQGVRQGRRARCRPTRRTRRWGWC